MATKYALVTEVVAGRIDWKLRVCVINLWNVPVKNSPADTQSMEIVLLDEKVRTTQFPFLISKEK